MTRSFPLDHIILYYDCKHPKNCQHKKFIKKIFFLLYIMSTLSLRAIDMSQCRTQVYQNEMWKSMIRATLETTIITYPSSCCGHRIPAKSRWGSLPQKRPVSEEIHGMVLLVMNGYHSGREGLSHYKKLR